MKNKHNQLLVYIFLFLIAFFPRAINPVAAPIHWFWRPLQFYRALVTGNLDSTFQSGHPGVTVMWLSGFSESIYREITGFPASLDPSDVLPMYYISPSAILSGLLPLVFLISLGVCLTYFLLSKLFNREIALLASIFIALDPFYLYQSKILHLDATLANLMMLSALSFLVFMKEKDRKYLIASAILGGFALLTKTPAIFLIPFVALSLLVFNWIELNESIKQRTYNSFFVIFKPFFYYSLVLGLVFFLAFPAFWVSPIATFQKIFALGVKKPITAPHGYQNYFLGEILVLKHIGLKFYLLTAAFFSTPLTLLSYITGFIYLFQKRIQKEQRVYALLIFLYSIFFLIMVSIAAKNGIRYLAPFFPMFSIFSALGFYWFYKSIVDFVKIKVKIDIRKSVFFVCFILLLNFFPVVKRYPYFGTYYNPLLGGAKSASFVFPLGDQAEGVDQALKYIDEVEENPENLRIGCDTPLACIQHTKGMVLDIDDETADYLVFLRNKVIRQTNKKTWDIYKDQVPEKVISFDEIPYVWVYKAI
ncbi:hypothetical protein COT51_03380 [candidate division WWE3 bacterium CG08_land_8_20_14_0_20_41_15]|uniref:Glycosyltransferase RgtA/B/C/D-like domain-containing protein n=1 Tax=candidate division WWE3 bacterium CG08_land_8_20_14_0_20_41_15 TaxID=1975086 RepID=A0A2H0XB55_UNCKA|nr:MAG: hypothetical protein COT51_03380 [candidate division WWE3 bacterium CG08_land_8_20_14_0_20_41_15]